VDPSVLAILGHVGDDPMDYRVDWRRLVHPQDHERTRAAAYAYLEGRANVYDTELRMLHKDGSLRWFHTRGSLVRREDGTVYRMVGTFTDVTERKHAETLLREQEAVLRASHQEIGHLAGRLIFAQETERKRLARELHDDLSQKVALLSIDLDQLRQEAPDFATRLRRISAFTGDIATEVHQLSHQLHPFKLEALGLVAAIQSVCNDVSAQSGLDIEFQHDRVPARIHPDVTLCLFRIVQEGIRNVIKHSRARRVWVYLGKSDPDLALQIADSGVGFDLAKHERSGLGLVSMRERVNFLGGELVIHSLPGSGTRIGVRVPLEPLQVELASADVQRLPGEECPRAEQRRLPAEEPLPILDQHAPERLPESA
jgi:PAS domain S-box-containing protein